MRESLFNWKNRLLSAIVLVPVLLFLFLAPCAPKGEIIGKWREVGKEAIIEFSEDGSFQALDNQGMSVTGKYILFKDGMVRCEIKHENTSKEIVTLKISVKKDELTLSALDGTEPEIYRREK